MFLPQYKPRRETTRIILHDSHTPPDQEGVEDVPRWHLQAHEGALRMGLLGIGYHFVVERDGRVVTCREEDRIGSHTPGHNLDSIGICLVGGRDENGKAQENFLTAQKVSVFQLISRLHNTWGLIPVHGRYEIQRYRNKKTPRSPYLDMEQFRQDLDIFKQMGVILDS